MFFYAALAEPKLIPLINLIPVFKTKACRVLKHLHSSGFIGKLTQNTNVMLLAIFF